MALPVDSASILPRACCRSRSAGPAHRDAVSGRRIRWVAYATRISWLLRAARHARARYDTTSTGTHACRGIDIAESVSAARALAWRTSVRRLVARGNAIAVNGVVALARRASAGAGLARIVYRTKQSIVARELIGIGPAIGAPLGGTQLAPVLGIRGVCANAIAANQTAGTARITP